VGRRLVLIVSGHLWAREIAAALKRSGIAVRMWVGPLDHQTAARDAGLDADRGRIMVDAISREEELEEVTDALLLTGSDDFNTLGAAELRDELGHQHVYRVAPPPDEPDLLPPPREAGIFGNRSLTFAELDRQFAAGARIVSRSADQAPRPEGHADRSAALRGHRRWSAEHRVRRPPSQHAAGRHGDRPRCSRLTRRRGGKTGRRGSQQGPRGHEPLRVLQSWQRRAGLR